MIKVVLKGIAIVLMMAVGTLLFLYLGRTDPWGVVPGKRLVGEEVTGPIEDWAFTEQARIVTKASDTDLGLELRTQTAVHLHYYGCRHG